MLVEAGILRRGLCSTGRTGHQYRALQQGHEEGTGEKDASITTLYGVWSSLQAGADYGRGRPRARLVNTHGDESAHGGA